MLNAMHQVDFQRQYPDAGWVHLRAQYEPRAREYMRRMDRDPAGTTAELRAPMPEDRANVALDWERVAIIAAEEYGYEFYPTTSARLRMGHQGEGVRHHVRLGTPDHLRDHDVGSGQAGIEGHPPLPSQQPHRRRPSPHDPPHPSI